MAVEQLRSTAAKRKLESDQLCQSGEHLMQDLFEIILLRLLIEIGKSSASGIYFVACLKMALQSLMWLPF